MTRDHTIRIIVGKQDGHTMVSLHRSSMFDSPFGPGIDVLGFSDIQMDYEEMLTEIGRAIVEGPRK